MFRKKRGEFNLQQLAAWLLSVNYNRLSFASTYHLHRSFYTPRILAMNSAGGGPRGRSLCHLSSRRPSLSSERTKLCNLLYTFDARLNGWKQDRGREKWHGRVGGRPLDYGNGLPWWMRCASPKTYVHNEFVRRCKLRNCKSYTKVVAVFVGFGNGYLGSISWISWNLGKPPVKNSKLSMVWALVPIFFLKKVSAHLQKVQCWNTAKLDIGIRYIQEICIDDTSTDIA